MAHPLSKKICRDAATIAKQKFSPGDVIERAVFRCAKDTALFAGQDLRGVTFRQCNMEHVTGLDGAILERCTVHVEEPVAEKATHCETCGQALPVTVER